MTKEQKLGLWSLVGAAKCAASKGQPEQNALEATQLHTLSPARRGFPRARMESQEVWFGVHFNVCLPKFALPEAMRKAKHNYPSKSTLLQIL